LKNDPKEQSLLSNSLSSDKISQAKEILKGHKDETQKSSKHFGVGTGKKVILDRDKKEKLKALDYIQ